MEQANFNWEDEAQMERMSSKTVALLYLRTKRSEIMDLALAFQPTQYEDPEEYEMNLNVFIELTNFFTAMGSAIDMVETVQKDIYKAQLHNTKLQVDNGKLLQELKEAREIINNLQERIDL